MQIYFTRHVTDASVRTSSANNSHLNNIL